MSFIPYIIGVLPSLVWVLFFLSEDNDHPEPKYLIFLTFLAGAAVTFLALGPQLLVNNILLRNGFGQYSPVTLFFLGGIEEVFKFLAVYAIVSSSKELDEPIDAMIYMVVASLGFAAIENIASLFHDGSIIAPQGQLLQISSLRFVGATLLHSLSSAFVGYYWGLSLIQKSDKLSLIIEGLGVATVLHASFNGLVVLLGPEAFAILVFLSTAAFFVLNDFERLKKMV